MGSERHRFGILWIELLHDLCPQHPRGAHFREDFTAVGSLEDSYFTIARRAGEAILVERAPVEFTIVKPGESLI